MEKLMIRFIFCSCIEKCLMIYLRRIFLWEDKTKMSDVTKENLVEKLDYLGLNLENVPEVLKTNGPLEYKPSRTYEENVYKVYKMVDVREIEILISPTGRMDSAKEKYEKAEPVYPYISPEKEEDVLKHGLFLKMLNDLEIEKVEELEEEQQSFQKKIPFRVKYKDNYLWQIYYSVVSRKYFMLVTTKDSDYSCFFYLLKKKIEAQKTKKKMQIFIPISHSEYSGELLRRTEISEIENYLWLFAKDWPSVYEVYDAKGNQSLQIVGESVIYEQMKSIYKIELSSPEEALQFYKLVKALFLLQTELPKNYEFTCQIAEDAGIEFFYQGNPICYENMKEFIQKEYRKVLSQREEKKKENDQLQEEMQELKKKEKEKRLEFLEKEKEITIYLECKKTLIGKLKYFFQHSKKRKIGKKKKDAIEELKEDSIGSGKEEKQEKIVKEKEYYTIEELVEISKSFNECLEHNRNLKLDKTAMENKIEMLNTKIKNANRYLEEVEEHNRSLFEFWKYTSKDESLALAPGMEKEENEKSKTKIERIFDYKEDFEEIGIKIDSLQRSLFSKEECDAIFIAGTNVLKVINEVKEYPEKTQMILKKALTEWKKESKEEGTYRKDAFDVFGTIAPERGASLAIGGKAHREVEKNKFKLLEIHEKTKLERLEEIIEEIEENIEKALEKMKAPIGMAIFAESMEMEDVENRNSVKNTEEVVAKKKKEKENLEEQNQKRLEIFHINPDSIIEKNNKKKEITIKRYQVKEGMNIVYFSNIIYFDNYNQTLPVGMNLSDKVLLDEKKYQKNIIKEQTIRRNLLLDEKEILTQTLYIKEYELR